MSGLIWVQTVSKGYQQVTKALNNLLAEEESFNSGAAVCVSFT